MKKAALSEREIEALKLLRENLPEYEIYPNMRLADVIKADWKLFNRISKYHLDFVVCDHQANVIAAVELDDSTHDNPKAQERDAKKDDYLHSAGIRFFRIRLPHEAIHVAKLIKGGGSERTAVNPRDGISIGRKSNSNTLAKIAISVTGMFAIWMIFSYTSQSFQKQLVEQQQIQIQRVQEVTKRVQQPIQNPPQASLKQPDIAKILVKGKSAHECMNTDGALDNNTVLCMTDHYEMVQSDQSADSKLEEKSNLQRNAAWKKYYKEPQHCINPKGGDETRECLSLFINAKKAFNAEWESKNGKT